MSTTESNPQVRSARLVVAPMMAIISVMLLLAFILQDRAAMADAAPGLGSAITIQLLAQAVGGFICGWIFAGLFGRGGAMGWVLSLVIGVVVTLLSGALGGFLAGIPVILSTGFDLAEVLSVVASALSGPLAFERTPMLAVVWLGLLLLTHLLAARHRRG